MSEYPKCQHGIGDPNGLEECRECRIAELEGDVEQLRKALDHEHEQRIEAAVEGSRWKAEAERLKAHDPEGWADCALHEYEQREKIQTQHAAEVAEFNAGWEAAQRGEPMSNDPEPPEDNWRNGWCAFHGLNLQAEVERLREHNAGALGAHLAVSAERDKAVAEVERLRGIFIPLAHNIAAELDGGNYDYLAEELREAAEKGEADAN
jgi:hypothetical protein